MKYLTFTSCLFLSLSMSCGKPNVVEREIPVSKSIAFRVSQASDYSASVYDGVQAEVRLTVSKQIAGLIDPVILWDTVIPYQSLRLYPDVATPLLISKQFNDIFERKETIRFNRIVRYKTALNQISSDAVGEDIPAFVNNRLIEVKL